MKNTQEKINLQVLIPSSTLSTYQDLMKQDTSQSIENSACNILF